MQTDFGNETLKIIKRSRSIRSYKDEQIKDEELQAILEAELYYYVGIYPRKCIL